jgi:subtilisin-like proprotein convertase family protein
MALEEGGRRPKGRLNHTSSNWFVLSGKFSRRRSFSSCPPGIHKGSMHSSINSKSGILILIALFVTSSLSVYAQISQTNIFSGINQPVPDGNASGLSDRQIISSSITELSRVRVKVRIAGEFNGDLYGYVRQITPTETNFCILLNRPGRTTNDPFGYDDMGLDITFDDAASNGDIHRYQSVITPVFGSPLAGSWQPDGRNVLPLTVTDASPRTTALSAFSGQAAGGEWTLFLADLESGGTNMLVSWGLELSGTGMPSITWAAPSNIVYGTALGASQLRASSSIPGTFTYNPPAGTVLNAGVHTLAVTFTPQDSANYETVTTNVAITVLRKPLTIAANSAAKVYGAALPPFAATITGLVNGDTPATLDSPVTFTTTATPNSNAGTYPINPAGASDANYVISFAAGTLTVSRANTTGTLTTSANPALPGQQLTFTFIASAAAPSTATPAGTVLFKIGATTTSVPLVNGTAALNTSSLSPGSHIVVAEFASTSNFVGVTNRLNPDQLINTPPIAATDELPRYSSSGAKVRIATLLRNDSDADGHLITFVSFSAATANGGTIVRDVDWLHYVPPTGSTNDDSFTYTISDGLSQPVTGTVNIRASSQKPSNLKITALGDGSFAIRFDGVPDVTYHIEFSDDPNSTNWVSLGSRTADETGMFEIIDRPPTGSAVRVYRSAGP